MFYSSPHPFAWFASVTHVQHQAGITRAFATELGGGHIGVFEESLDCSEQVHGMISPVMRGSLASVRVHSIEAISYFKDDFLLV